MKIPQENRMFYRGDIIQCVDPNPVLSLNRVYAVLRGGRDPVITNDLGFEASYHCSRFRIVEPVSKQTQIDEGRGK